MKEGWHHDDYLILFEAGEATAAAARYDLNRFLPGFDVVGLKGWDDLIVRSSNGRLFTVPTVPINKEHIVRFEEPGADVPLVHDARYTGKIKWYIKPISLGGDPGIGENLTWVSHKQHGELVVWWNQLIRDIKSSPDGA